MSAVPSQMVLSEMAQNLRPETRLFIDGKFQDAASGKTFETVNPATGKVIARVAEGDSEDIDRAVIAARRAFEGGAWRKMAPRERRHKMFRLAELIDRDTLALGLLESVDNGRPVAGMVAGDMPGTADSLRWHAEAIDKIYDQISRTPRHIQSLIVREPIGVVGTVIPWNFPVPIFMMKLAPAMASGNSVIIKPAEQTSLTALHLAALVAEAGIPDGVVNVITGYGETAGQALGRHMDVDCLSFTGSTEVGRYFLKYAAESNLKRVSLELGGKSPVIVMPDVKNMKSVVEQVTKGILFGQGENCSAGSRLFAHSSIREELMEGLIKSFNTWKVGDPLAPDTKIGAMIDANHLDRVISYVDAGKSGGATLTLGGERLLVETGGSYIGPTIFENVSNGMKIAEEEIFGPVLAAMTFETVEEAVRLANDTTYGLHAQLYTDDLTTAHTVSRQIRAGQVSVNCFSEGDNTVPFGGYKQSGFGGSEKGLVVHDQYTLTKTIWMLLQ